MKALIWGTVIVLALIIGGLGFIHFSPGYSIYFVRSGSMVPALNLGDVVVVGPVSPSGIRPGAIISYELGQSLITHRVLSVAGDTIITKGDANEDPDPRPVQLSQVRGDYLFKVPYVGYLSSFIRTRLGWFLAIILPVMALVGFIVKDIIREALKNEEKAGKSRKAGKPVRNIARANDPLQDIIKEALRNEDRIESTVKSGSTVGTARDSDPLRDVILGALKGSYFLEMRAAALKAKHNIT